MNTTSASPAERPPQDAAAVAAASTTARQVLVWDLPVRVFHWSMAIAFAGAWLTAESERWRLLHVSLGYTMAVLVLFRLAWGLIGTRHARFVHFVRGPAAVLAYLRSLPGRDRQHHVGHNPAGAWAIVGLLALAAVVVATGWANYQSLGGEWLEEVHEGAATAMLALVLVHVAGVALSSLLHHENLVGAMFTGLKHGQPADAIRSPWRSVAVLLLAAVLATLALSWSSAPVSGEADRPQAEKRFGHDDD